MLVQYGSLPGAPRKHENTNSESLLGGLRFTDMILGLPEGRSLRASEAKHGKVTVSGASKHGKETRGQGAKENREAESQARGEAIELDATQFDRSDDPAAASEEMAG